MGKYKSKKVLKLWNLIKLSYFDRYFQEVLFHLIQNTNIRVWLELLAQPPKVISKPYYACSEAEGKSVVFEITKGL